MPPTQTKRARLLENASPQELDKLARSYGFPSAYALQTMVELGAHLRSNPRAGVTANWQQRLARAYPHVPAATLKQYAAQVSTVDDLARVIGVPADVANNYVADFHTHQTAAEVDARMDQSRGEADDAERPKTRSVTPSDERTQAIQAAMRKHGNYTREERMEALPPEARREVLASRLDAQAQLRDERAREYDPKEPFAAERSRYDDVSRAFDSVALQGDAAEEIDAMDVEDAQA